MKTKLQIQKYNKEYSARPEVIAWAKIRNARPERQAVRKAYKQSEAGKEAERRYRMNHWNETKPLREQQLLKRYGLTPLQYEELLLAQKNVCAICRELKNERLHVDHCHGTGQIRGLLCGSCNRALGLLKDNVEFLVQAIKYLSQ